MKVIKCDKDIFKPITITLETIEEADAFWDMLNVNNNRSLTNYFHDYPKRSFSQGLKVSMWETFNTVHRPLEE